MECCFLEFVTRSITDPGGGVVALDAREDALLADAAERVDRAVDAGGREGVAGRAQRRQGLPAAPARVEPLAVENSRAGAMHENEAKAKEA